MAVLETQHSYPMRAKAARHMLQAVAGVRGHVFLSRLLRSVLRLPRHLVIDLDGKSSLQINCDLDEFIQWWVFSYGLKAEPDFEAMRHVLRPKDRFVDVGANIGIFSLLASLVVGTEGVVYAIEALPTNRELLEMNIALNKLTNVDVVPAALASEDGEVEIFPSTNGNLGMTSLSPAGEKGSPLRVTARSLDSLIADGTVSGCDVMKIDIEGAEPIALRGMQGLFKQSPPRVVLIEVSETLLADFGATPSEVMDFFLERGYNWFRASKKGLQSLDDLNIRGHNNLWAVRMQN